MSYCGTILRLCQPCIYIFSLSNEKTPIVIHKSNDFAILSQIHPISLLTNLLNMPILVYSAPNGFFQAGSRRLDNSAKWLNDRKQDERTSNHEYV